MGSDMTKLYVKGWAWDKPCRHAGVHSADLHMMWLALVRGRTSDQPGWLE